MANRLAPGTAFHDRTLKFFESVFTRGSDQRAKLEPLWTELHDAFVGYERQARMVGDEQRTDIVYLVYHFIETIAAYIVDNMLPEEDFGSMRGRGSEDREPGELLTTVLQWRFQKAKVRQKLIKIIFQSLIFGVSWGKVSWLREFRFLSTLTGAVDPETGLDKQDYEISQILAYSGPDLVPKSIWDVWWDRYMTSIDGGWIIDRDWMTLGQIRSMAESAGWVNVSAFEKKLVGITDSSDNVSRLPDEHDKMAYDVTDSMPGQPSDWGDRVRVTGKSEHPILEYCGPFDYHDDGNYIPCIIDASIDQRIVFRVEPAPNLHGQSPWIAAVPMPWLNQFHGMSVAGVNLTKQNYINDILKLTMTNFEKAVNTVILKDSDARINSKQFRFKSFNVYDVQTRPGLPITQMLHFLQAPDIKPSALGIMNEILALAKVESSVEDFFATGQTRGVTKTASGIAQITDRASSRHKLKISVVEEDTVKRLGYQFFALDQQYATDEDVAPVLGTDEQGEPVPFPRLSVEDIVRWWDFYPVGSATILNKQSDQENLTFLMQTLMNNLEGFMAAGFVVNLKKVWDGLAKKVKFPELADAVQVAPPVQPPTAPAGEPGKTEPDMSGAAGMMPEGEMMGQGGNGGMMGGGM